jgi:hypothetical protein
VEVEWRPSRDGINLKAGTTMTYCLPRAFASQFLKALQDGTLDADTLANMKTSAERRAAFTPSAVPAVRCASPAAPKGAGVATPVLSLERFPADLNLFEHRGIP